MSDGVLVVVGVGGMGEAIARRSGPGRAILLADRNEELLAAVAGSLRAEGHDVATRAVDVAAKESVAALAATAAGMGPVRQVAHTAGLSPVQASPEAILAVDLAGVAYSLDAFAAVMAPGGAGVVIASMAGTMAAGHLPAEMEAALATTPADELLSLPFLSAGGLDAGSAYSIAKRANQVRVQAAAGRWGERGARVNSLSPGVISTPMGLEELSGQSGEMMRGFVEDSATGRLGTPSDIANAVAFLLGPDAAFVTGTDLLVDGGVIAAIRSGAIPAPGQ